MLETERKTYMFKTKQVWFSDYPFDVEGCDSVTFRECKSKVSATGFNCVPFTTMVIDLTQSVDTIWKDIERKTRQLIKKARREAVIVKINQNYEEFYSIQESFRERKGLSFPGLTLDFIKKYGTLFVAEVEGEIVGGQCYLEDANNIMIVQGSTKRLEVDKRKAAALGNATRLMIWEAINYAKNRGISEFDLGGYYTGEERDQEKERINVFKKFFGGRLAVYYDYEKDYSPLYALAKRIYRLRYPRFA